MTETLQNQNQNQNEQIVNLCRAFVNLNDIGSVYAFLEDVASPGEIKAMAQRLEAARLLNESKTYSEIMKATGAGTATISRVKRCLDSGSGGYRNVLSEL